MSEFKFACPICGQHMSCDREQAGSRIQCPTCFREVVVPQPPAGENSKFVLTASEARDRPLMQVPAAEPAQVDRVQARDYIVWAVVFVVGAGLAFGGYKLYRASESATQAYKAGPAPAPPSSPGAVSPADPVGPWTLDLRNVVIPDVPATGRIAGRSFTCQRATLHGGTLNLRQGAAWPPDLGLTVYLDVARSEDLVGQRLEFKPADKLPRIALRWKDAQGRPVKRDVTAPFALRLEFGPLSSNRMAGRIYCCIDDPQKSYVFGAFEAEVRKPAPKRSAARPGQPSSGD
ncbi:MAG: hypothetical protein NZ739_00255 [Verrucomicrobiae bacterium]|nr:hypothetical protein [Verrucomicrobiae bacterium]